MADVFISYSKTDALLARTLATQLEAKNYSVWWDSNLDAAEDFSEEIFKQLGDAKAVAVLWSASSVTSTWVRAEALIGHRDQKLIPIRTETIRTDDIRPPFNAINTLQWGNDDEVMAAISKQIATPPGAGVKIKSIYREALTFVGAGSAGLQLYLNLDGFIQLASWVQLFSAYWHYYFGFLFSWFFELIGLSFPRQLTGLLTFCLFLASAVIGLRLKYRGHVRSIGLTPESRTAMLVGSSTLIVLMAVIVTGAVIFKQETLPILLVLLWVVAMYFYPAYLLSISTTSKRKRRDLFIVVGIYCLIIGSLSVFAYRDVQIAPSGEVRHEPMK